MQAGFIGLGTMGASMAANLQKGLKARGDTLVVHDIRREAASRHRRDGAIWADSPQALAEQSEVIFTSLPGPPEFEAVSAGLLAGIRKGTAYFDLSTNSPTVVRKAYDAFAAKYAHLLDAPVSGGPRGAASERQGCEGVGAPHGAHGIGDQDGDLAVQAGLLGLGRVRPGLGALGLYVAPCRSADGMPSGSAAPCTTILASASSVGRRGMLRTVSRNA